LIDEKLSENWLAHGQDPLKRAMKKVGVPKQIRAEQMLKRCAEISSRADSRGGA